MSQGVARVVADRYRLVRELGRGGMGVVWHAHDELLDRDVAVKEIRLMGADADPRALREARAAAQLRHPGIVTVHDIVVDDGRPWIVMELIGGRSLGQVIEDEGRLDERRAALIGLRVLDALRAAHQRGVLHRDVKPPNILLDGDRVVLTDFGIAVIDGATALTATGQMVGSPAYLSPERINGRPATAAADLWALGVTLYAAVTGRSPFQREDVQSTFAAVLTGDPIRPAEAGLLWPTIHGLLAKDPARRLTADRAAVSLAAVASLPPPATPAPPPSPAIAAPTRPEAAPSPVDADVPPRPEVRRRLWVGALAVGALLVTAALVWTPGWLHRDLAGKTPTDPGARSASPATASATPSPAPAASPAQTPPAPPPGFMTVALHEVYTLAVPEKWVYTESGWANYDDSRAGSLVQVRLVQNPPAGMSAIAYLTKARKNIPGFHNYRRIRLTSMTAPRGAKSAAEWEYTTALTNYPRWGHEHSITRAIVLATGEVYVCTVSVEADTRSALNRDWAKARPTLLRILDSVQRAP